MTDRKQPSLAKMIHIYIQISTSTLRYVRTTHVFIDLILILVNPPYVRTSTCL